tara:strand:- start:6936 stop:7679 length:744 start_codon:yes stop_codon:yes gene_type:complete
MSEVTLFKFYKKSRIPNLNKSPLTYVLKDLSLTKGVNKVWVEFGTTNASNINEVAAETGSNVFSINNFGGMYSRSAKLLKTKERRKIKERDIIPSASSNVEYLKGTYMEILPDFLKNTVGKTGKITLLLFAPGIYSTTKYILDVTKNYMDPNGCYIIFEKLLNFPHGDVYTQTKDYRQKRSLTCELGKKYLNPRSEAQALYDFINQNTGLSVPTSKRKRITWIGINGGLGTSHYDGRSQMCALKISN